MIRVIDIGGSDMTRQRPTHFHLRTEQQVKIITGVVNRRNNKWFFRAYVKIFIKDGLHWMFKKEGIRAVKEKENI